MGEIKFTKDQFDTKCNYLNYMSGFINVDESQTVEVGKNVSQTVTDFVNIYELRQDVRWNNFISNLCKTIIQQESRMPFNDKFKALFLQMLNKLHCFKCSCFFSLVTIRTPWI